MYTRISLGLMLWAGLLVAGLAAAEDNASCATGSHLDGKRSYQVKLPTYDGHELSFQVLEPTQFDCANIARGAHPLLLHGPGYSGSRSTSGFDKYREAGYTVISWDPRGFGDTSGTVRVMDPDFEGQYYLQILDWAEQNLDYLAWRDEASGQLMAQPAGAQSLVGGPNLLLGAMGSSYGGGYQLLILTVDHKRRLDAIAPDITWHDLRDALNPGDVVKSLWDLALTGGGEAAGHSSGGAPTEDGQDPFIKETLSRGATLNEFPRQALDWFHYHGLGYWCAANGLPAMPYPDYAPDVIPMVDAVGSYNVPPREADGRPGIGDFLVAAADPGQHLAGLDVLLTQGMIDTLFNYNHAWWNFQCLKAAGAEVSLYTHNGGHTLPGLQSPDKLPANSGSCGVDKLAWFDDRLRGVGAVELQDTCFALGTDEDTVYLDADQVLAPQPLGGNENFTVQELVGNVPVGGVLAPSSAIGLLNDSGNTVVWASLGVIEEETILAGIPHLEVTIASLSGLNEMGHEMAGNADCMSQAIPYRTLGCDAIVFVGLGRRSGDLPNFGLIDDQVTPLRGLGMHSVDMVGVAERLLPGDELGVVFYGSHPQMFGSASRDMLNPLVIVEGTVSLPQYAVDADGQPQVRAQIADAADGRAASGSSAGGALGAYLIVLGLLGWRRRIMG